jgi:hypothetical protein
MRKALIAAGAVSALLATMTLADAQKFNPADPTGPTSNPAKQNQKQGKASTRPNAGEPLSQAQPGYGYDAPAPSYYGGPIDANGWHGPGPSAAVPTQKRPPASSRMNSR